MPHEILKSMQRYNERCPKCQNRGYTAGLDFIHKDSRQGRACRGTVQAPVVSTNEAGREQANAPGPAPLPVGGELPQEAHASDSSGSGALKLFVGLITARLGMLARDFPTLSGAECAEVLQMEIECIPLLVPAVSAFSKCGAVEPSSPTGSSVLTEPKPDK